MRYRSPDDILLQACRILFGPSLMLSTDFLHYVQLSGIKSAFRQRAKETHPDCLHAGVRSDSASEMWTFQQVRESYEILKKYTDQREKTINQPSPAFAEKTASQAGTGTWRNSPGGPRAAGWQYFRSKPSASPLHEFHRLPQRHLKLGHFLYFSGIVEWQDVIRALVWQKNSRPRIGELGQRLGLLNKDDLLSIFRATTGGHRFGESAIRLGLLNQEQVRRLIYYQKCRQQKIGQYFVEEEILTFRELLEQVRRCNLHNINFPAL